MIRVKKGDFVEIEYVGRVASDGSIFDLTDEKLARESKLYNQNVRYGPVVICVGEAQILRGIDDNLVGKEVGKKYKIELSAENAFGKKNPKLIKIIPMNTFKKQKIDVFPGMQINADGMIGVVRVVSGGRVIIDFNNPLAGRDVVYEISITKVLTDQKEKILGLFKFIGMDVDVKLEDKNAIIELKKEIPKEMEKELEKKIKKMVGLDEVKLLKKQPLENN